MKKLDELLARIPDLQERARQRAEREKRAPLPGAPLPKNVVQLPLWPEPVRAVPNCFLRSALFGAIKRGRRAYMQREKIASYEGVTILQTGPRLDQADLDVWEQCLHLMRSERLYGTRIRFSAHAFLKAIGRSSGGKDIEWLKGVLARLASTVVEVQDGKRAYFGPLLHHGARDDETGMFAIELNPAIVRLYDADGWTQVEWEQRLALKGQPLAQWLHGFYSTHAEPYPLKVETLHRLCGSETKQLYHFRAELRQALDALSAVTGWTWEIDDADCVHVRKTPTPGQARSLVRKRLRESYPQDTG